MRIPIVDPPSSSVEPARVNNPKQANLRSETEAWIEANPGVYELFLRFAREMKETRRPLSAKLLAERVRWELAFQKKGDYKLNNNHTAYIARRLIMDDPSLEPFLKFRKTQW